MLKRLTIFAVMIMAMPNIAQAVQVGGLSQNLGAQLLTVSANVGFVDRDVKSGATQDDFTSRNFMFRATYGASDKLDVHFDVGFADLQDLPGFDGSLGTAFGGGVKFLLFEGPQNNTRVSLNADILTFTSEDSGSDADYMEYAVSAVVSKKSGNMVPFGGLQFSKLDIDFSGGGDAEEDDSLGLFAGVDYFVNPNVYFTGEIHVFSENTIFLGAGYNF